jgi:predicted small integral membrane protein
MALVAIGNLSDGDANLPFVQHVLAMDSIPPDPATGWRAIHSTAIHHLALYGITIWETAAATVLLVGTVLLFVARTAQKESLAKLVINVGLAFTLVLFGVGFWVIGGEWFQMWRSAVWNGEEPAFRNLVIVLLTFIVVNFTSPNAKTGKAVEAVARSDS